MTRNGSRIISKAVHCSGIRGSKPWRKIPEARRNKACGRVLRHEISLAVRESLKLMEHTPLPDETSRETREQLQRKMTEVESGILQNVAEETMRGGSGWSCEEKSSERSSTRDPGLRYNIQKHFRSEIKQDDEFPDGNRPA
ncbi:hypothetical protein B0H19DRAFT_1073790 [Mycena capillaripes]|nr:hypothetical protein B0H19DRAFT_1073790 [Mycena capillaripes]